MAPAGFADAMTIARVKQSLLQPFEGLDLAAGPKQVQTKGAKAAEGHQRPGSWLRNNGEGVDRL